MTKPQLPYILIFVLLLTAAIASAQVTFTDVTNSMGLGHLTGDASTWGDYDSDGDADLLIIYGGGLYRNEGDAGFADVTKTVGITDTSLRGSYTATFMDFDNDGDLDLFVGGGSGGGDSMYRNENGTFLDISQPAGMDSRPRVYDGAVSFDYDNDGLLDIYIANKNALSPLPNLLYHNEGGGRFGERATQIGLDEPGLASGIALGDYDDDGDLDLFITLFSSAELEKEMVLYRNDGGEVFTDVAQEAGLQAKNSPSEAFFWDYDNDGDLDLFVESVMFYGEDDINILYRNNGNGTFTDVTQSAGIALIDNSGSGAYYGDYDNDGWLDLLVTYDRLPNLLYHNNRDGTFTDVSQAAGITGTNSGTTSFVDYDNDGDLDIFISPWLGGGTTLYRNDGTANHWLQLNLVGVQSNRDAIGARVTVIAGGLKMLREMAGSSGIGAMQDRLPLHFGLAGSPQADVIEIRWPSGIVQTLMDIPADQRLTINELEGIQVVLYGVSPAAGDPGGGTPVEIKGEHFLPGSRVFFGGVEAADAVVVPPSLMMAVTPPGARGMADVEVLGTDGKQGILRDGFRYTTVQVTGITPESGPVAGGTTVRIDGVGFQPGVEVQIGENALTDTFVAPTLIRGTTPPGEQGIVDVFVTNPDGEGDVLHRSFTYVPPPVIRSVSPAFAPLRGGEEITIRGSGFTGTPTVRMGGITCQRVVLLTPPNALEVITPPMSDVGPQDVVVINPDGQRAVLPDAVTFLAPIKIKSIEPASGGLEGGTRITIIGEPIVAFKPQYGGERDYLSRFVEGVDVFIGDAEATDVRVQSDNVITAITPPNTMGPKDVEVVNRDGQKDTLKDAFLYNPFPQIIRVIPNNGKLAGGTVITIRGSGFLPGAKVLISTETGTLKTASSVQVISPETIMAVTPAGNPGPKDVIIRNPDKQEMTIPEGFTYNPMPTIIRITPDFGAASGGTRLIIEGTGFLQGARVMVGERVGTTMVKDDMTIEAVTPPNRPGLWDVHVINPDTQRAVMREAFVSVGELVYNYPNPFRASEGTTFRYVTNARVDVITVRIFNLRGVPIGIVRGTGSNEVRWYKPDVHVGIYVYLLEARLEDGQVRKFKNMLEVCK